MWTRSRKRILEHQRSTHRYTEWTGRCMRQSDIVLLVANGEMSPPGRGSASDALLRTLLALSETNAIRELVMLHCEPLPSDYEPRFTKRWIEFAGGIAQHHHVRLHASKPLFDLKNFKSSIRSLARQLTGNAIGLVLGGGGARGLAHIGAIRALEEASIPVDFVGGA